MRHTAFGHPGRRGAARSTLWNFAALMFPLAMLIVSLPLLPQPATAQTGSQPPGSVGCVATATSAVSLFDGEQTPSSGVDLDVPGPVTQVIVEWMGYNDTDSPVSALELTVTRPDGTTASVSAPGTLAMADNTRIDGSGFTVYSWFADITSHFGAGDPGAYNVDIEPFATAGVGLSWGATVHAVYDTSPCTVDSAIEWNIGADYYFGGGGGASPTTSTISFTFEPLAAATVGHLSLSHGGSDSQTGNCRVSVVWAVVGSGTPPAASDPLVWPDGVVAWPGATEAIVDPFTPPNQPCPPLDPQSPVVSASGGNVGPEYALIDLGIEIPAGSTWVAIQLESPPDNFGFAGTPESGAVSAGGAFVLPVPPSDPAPAITLEKTVVAAGETCPGVQGTDELITGAVGTPVTYCFNVTNTGNTYLSPVTIDDPDLGITDADMTLVSGDPTVALAPGDSIVWSYDATIEGALTNTATSSGTPSDPEGTPTGDEPVEDDDDASVTADSEEPVPGILLEKTVLPAGSTCPGVEGVDELYTADVGSGAVLCYRIVNTGTTALLPVVLTDPGLGLGPDDFTIVSDDTTVPLVPGGVLVYEYPTTIGLDPVTTDGEVVGTAAADDGEPLGLPEVTDVNDAGVEPIDPKASITLEKTVLYDRQDGPTCPGIEGVDELVLGVDGTKVQFCYYITNNGDTPLFPVQLTDPDLGLGPDDFTIVSGNYNGVVMPGDTLLLVHRQPISGDAFTEARAEGQPSTDTGDGLALDPVFAVNDAGVAMVAPAVLLEKTVLPGHDQPCPGVEAIDEMVMATTESSDVTYCFRVVNTGGTALIDITLDDPILGITDADMALVDGDMTVPLEPDYEIVWAYNSRIQDALTNVATVTGQPSASDGQAFDTGTVTSTNDASVDPGGGSLPELPVTGSAASTQLRFALMMLFAGLALIVMDPKTLWQKQ